MIKPAIKNVTTHPPRAPVSIVLPTLGAGAQLTLTVLGILSQALLPREVVVVVVGQKSLVDGYARELNSRAALVSVTLQWIYEPGAFPGAARNAGIRVAQADWIGFLDTGIVPNADWLKELWAKTEWSGGRAFKGTCVFRPVSPLGTMICAGGYGVGSSKAVLPASLFHKSLFCDVAYFAPNLRAAEDIKWLDAICGSGERVESVNTALVEYRFFPNSLAASLRKSFIYGKYAAVAGVGTPIRVTLTSSVLLAVPGGYFYPTLPLCVLSAYFLFRGVIDPIRRSAQRIWWQFWWQPLVMPAFLLASDVSAVSGRVYGLALRVVRVLTIDEK